MRLQNSVGDYREFIGRASLASYSVDCPVALASRTIVSTFHIPSLSLLNTVFDAMIPTTRPPSFDRLHPALRALHSPHIHAPSFIDVPPAHLLDSVRAWLAVSSSQGLHIAPSADNLVTLVAIQERSNKTARLHETRTLIYKRMCLRPDFHEWITLLSIRAYRSLQTLAFGTQGSRAHRQHPYLCPERTPLAANPR